MIPQGIVDVQAAATLLTKPRDTTLRFLATETPHAESTESPRNC